MEVELWPYNYIEPHPHPHPPPTWYTSLLKMDSWTNNENDLSFAKAEDHQPCFCFLICCCCFFLFFSQLNSPDKKSAFSCCSCTVCQLITLCVLSKRVVCLTLSFLLTWARMKLWRWKWLSITWVDFLSRGWQTGKVNWAAYSLQGVWGKVATTFCRDRKNKSGADQIL